MGEIAREIQQRGFVAFEEGFFSDSAMDFEQQERKQKSHHGNGKFEALHLEGFKLKKGFP